MQCVWLQCVFVTRSYSHPVIYDWMPINSIRTWWKPLRIQEQSSWLDSITWDSACLWEMLVVGGSEDAWWSMRSRQLDNGQVLFLLCVYGLQHKYSKKEWAQYPVILTGQVLSVKELHVLYMRINDLIKVVLIIQFPCRKQQVILDRQDSLILPAQIANPNAGFVSFQICDSQLLDCP